MEPHVKRLRKEHKKLEKKIGKLKHFLATYKPMHHQALSPEELTIMQAQLAHMRRYSNCLWSRLGRVHQWR